MSCWAALRRRPDRASRPRRRQGSTSSFRRKWRKKDYEAALKTCRELLALAPHDYGTLYNLACVQARLGQKKEALATLSQAVEDSYADWEHMQEDEDLASLRDDAAFKQLVDKARKNEYAKAYRPGKEIAGVKTIEDLPEGGLRYRLRMDPAATAEKPNKLIVWLHPSSGPPMSSAVNDKVEAMAPMFLKHGYALVTFTQKNFSGWSGRDVRKLSLSLKQIEKIAGIDAKKPILFGYSAGGQMALGQWKRNPGRFGGLVLDAAYPIIMSPGGGKPMELDADHVDPAVKTVPILALVGGADPVAESWQKVEAEMEAGRRAAGGDPCARQAARVAL